MVKKKVSKRKTKPVKKVAEKKVEKKLAKKIAQKPATKKLVKKLAAKTVAPKPAMIEKKEIKKVGVPQEDMHFATAGAIDPPTGGTRVSGLNPRLEQYQRAIQYEVDRVWQPPIGVAKGTECLVHFVVNRAGAVDKITIQKPSGMIIYDLSIVHVGKSFKFARCLWGKNFTVNFRQ